MTFGPKIGACLSSKNLHHHFKLTLLCSVTRAHAHTNQYRSNIWRIKNGNFEWKGCIYSLSAISAINKNTHVWAPPLTAPPKNRESTKCNGDVPNVRNSQLICNYPCEKWKRKMKKTHKNKQGKNNLLVEDPIALTNCGNPIKKMVCLIPIIVIIYPHIQLPIIAPSETTDPIHDISSTYFGEWY